MTEELRSNSNEEPIINWNIDNHLKELEAEKLIAETSVLKLQTGGTSAIEWVKAFAGLAGVLTAVVALLGLYVSVERNQAEDIRILDSQRREQRNAAILLLTDENLSKQLGGISTLESFFPSENQTGKLQQLNLLANLLAVEQKKIVRDAIIDSIESKELSSLEEKTRTAAVRRLTALSRSLVAEGKLDRKREGNRFGHLDTTSIEARAQSVGKTLTLYLHAGTKFTDFRRTYLTFPPNLRP